MVDGHILINLRRVHIIRHQNLSINKNPFLDKSYFTKRKRKLRELNAA